MISNEAHAKIRNNFIGMNNHQGVLITENSSARVFYNEIYKNIKANISVGGRLSQETQIIHNKIYSGASQGIFMIYTAKTKIYYNKIFNNYVGIQVTEGDGDIQFNQIKGSTTNGIHLVNNAHPFIGHNSIRANSGIGILIHNDCNPVLETNVLKENELDLVSTSDLVKKHELEQKKTKGENNVFLKKQICLIF